MKKKRNRKVAHMIASETGAVMTVFSVSVEDSEEGLLIGCGTKGRRD
jgi:hypothetical protein